MEGDRQCVYLIVKEEEMAEVTYHKLCSIKHCDMWAESIKRFGLELCHVHQLTIDKWLIEKGYNREIK